MTEKDFKVKRMEFDVREQETRVRDAKLELDLGYARLKADFEKEYAKLKSTYEREVIKLEREKTYLAVARSELDKGFD